MLSDIETWLGATGLKISEECFIKPPALPYVIYTDNPDVGGSDTKNNIANRSINIELYSKKIDRVSEGLIEILLNEKTIKYKKDHIYIDTEMMFETVYDFNLIEKF